MRINLGLSPGANLRLGLSHWYGVSGSGGVTPPTPSPLLTNLISYWPLNETGGTRLDVVGTRHMAPVGAVSYYQGKIDNGVFISGTQNNLVYVGTNELRNLPWGSGFTVAGWVYAPTPYSIRQTILSKGSTSGSADFALYTNSQNQLRFDVLDVSGTISQAQNTSLLTTDEFHFFAGRYNPTTKRAEFRLDGGGWSTGTPLTRPVRNVQSLLSIGVKDGSFGKAVYDEIGLWMEYLSDANVDLLWNSGNGTTWPFTYVYSPPYITYLSRDDFTLSPQLPYLAMPLSATGTRMMWPGFGSWFPFDNSGTLSLLSGRLFKASGSAGGTVQMYTNPLTTGAYPMSTIGRVLTLTVNPLLLTVIIGDSLNYLDGDLLGAGGYNKKLRFQQQGTGFYFYNVGNSSAAFDPAISTYTLNNASGSARFYSATPMYLVQAGQRFLYMAGPYLLFASSRFPQDLGYPNIQAVSNAQLNTYDNFAEAILPAPFDTEWSMAQTRNVSASSGTMMTVERNGQVEATWTPTTGTPTFNLMFRYLDANNYWTIRNTWTGFTSGTTNLVRRMNGTEAIIVSNTQNFVTGTARVVSADFFNSVIHYTVDGIDKGNTTSGSFNMLETLATVDRPVTDFVFWSNNIPAAHQAVLNNLTGTPTWTFQDTFSGTGLLQNHLPNMGSGTWSRTSANGSIELVGNKAFSVSGSATTYSINAGISDYIFQGTMRQAISTGFIGVIVRGTDLNNSIVAYFRPSTGQMTLFVSGTSSAFANASLKIDQDYDFTVVTQGPNVHFIMNGSAISISTTYNQTNKNIGLYASSASGSWSNLRL